MKIEKTNETKNATILLSETNFSSGLTYTGVNYSVNNGRITSLGAEISKDGVSKGNANCNFQNETMKNILLNVPTTTTIAEQQAILSDFNDIYNQLANDLAV